MNSPLEKVLNQFLIDRENANALRKLKLLSGLSDFSSNDYLGFAKSFVSNHSPEANLGSGGSRLISGNSQQAEQAEDFLAAQLNAQASLIFNSGYDANLGLFSSLPKENAILFFDKLVHASIHDGIKLSGLPAFSFKHNNVRHLEQLIEKANGTIFVAIESLYSMEGDAAPLDQFIDLVDRYQIHLIVDEAHAFGIFGANGRGFTTESNYASKCFARVYTFSKAVGYHGACVVGSQLLKNYLINTARSFIYSTALPPSTYCQIQNSVEAVMNASQSRQALHENIKFFKKLQQDSSFFDMCSSNSGPIQWIRIPEQENTVRFANFMHENGIDVRAILPPTVPPKQSRIRINLHSFNTPIEITHLFNKAEEFFKKC
jgi:8-amino-7-oxononanoate synthase